MLTLTKKTDYALIALAHLARQPKGVASAREIGDLYHVPLPLLMNILKTLTRGGVVQSIRGARGGYALTIDPNEITLTRLVEILEGPIRFVQCAVGRRHEGKHLGCELEGSCPVRTPTMRIHVRLKEFMNTVTLADIALDPEPVRLSVRTSGTGELVDEDACIS
jgi:Rrf2 family protein